MQHTKKNPRNISQTQIKKTAKKSVTVGFSEKPEGGTHIPLKPLGNKCPVFFGHFENLSLVAVQFLNAEQK